MPDQSRPGGPFEIPKFVQSPTETDVADANLGEECGVGGSRLTILDGSDEEITLATPVPVVSAVRPAREVGIKRMITRQDAGQSIASRRLGRRRIPLIGPPNTGSLEGLKPLKDFLPLRLVVQVVQLPSRVEDLDSGEFCLGTTMSRRNPCSAEDLHPRGFELEGGDRLAFQQGLEPNDAASRFHLYGVTLERHCQDSLFLGLVLLRRENSGVE